MSSVGQILNELRTGNARYVADGGRPRDYSVNRNTIASSPPIATLLTCSDVKFVPEQVFGLEIGSLEIIQTAACVCTDPRTLGIDTGGTEEAARLIVVLGHTPCGVIEYSLANPRDPLNKIAEAILDNRSRLVSASTLPTPVAVCEAHLARTTQALRKSLDPTVFRVEAAHLDESRGVVRFLDIGDPDSE